MAALVFQCAEVTFPANLVPGEIRENFVRDRPSSEAGLANARVFKDLAAQSRCPTYGGHGPLPDARRDVKVMQEPSQHHVLR